MDQNAAQQDYAGLPEFLSGGGEMGALMRAFDWASSPLGTPDRWPQALRTVVRLMLTTNHPMFIFWGSDHRCLYNDAYKASIGPEKHPAMLGARGRDMWEEIWPIIGPQIEHVMQGRGATWHEDHLVPIIRNGRLEDVYWTYGYSPIDHADGVGGVLVICNETTTRVIADRDKTKRVLELDQLAAVFMKAPSFVSVLLGPEHNFNFVNEAYQRLIGHRDVVGKNVREALPDIEGQGFYELLDRVYETGERFIGNGVKVRLQPAPTDPEIEVVIDFIYEPMRDAFGHIYGIFVEGHDVTEQAIEQLAVAERLAAEADLKLSEERFRAAVAAVQGTLWTNSAEGRMVGEQPGWAALTGQSFDEYQGYGWSDAVHPEDRQPSIDVWNEAVRERKIYIWTHRVKTAAHNDWRTFSTRAIPVFAGDGAIREWVGVHTDITDRLAAQEAIRTSEERFRNLANAMPQLVWTAGGDGRVDYYNARRADYAGAESSDLDWIPLIHEDDFAGTMTAWHEAAKTGKPYDFEHRLKMKNGAWRWHVSRAIAFVSSAGAPTRWFGTATDVHDLKTAEARLRQNNESLEQRVSDALAEKNVLADIVETTDAFVQVADLDYRWIAINKASATEFERIFGIRPRVGDSMLDLLRDQPEHREAVQAVWSRALAGEQFTETAVFGDPGRDRRAYEMKFNVLRDRNGAQIGAYQFVYDVTQRLADQERLAQAHEALRQAQKMEAVGQLTGGVAHDFNNLLMAISGGLRMLDRPGDPERKQRIRDGVYRAVERGAGLTRQLLAFSRRRPLEARPISINEHVAGMSELLERSLRGDVHVAMSLPTKLWNVEVDPGELELAILNLCVNARDAMPSGGVIEIEAKNITLSEGPMTGKAVRLTIRDKGEGMDEATLSRVFEPFFTTKEVGKGSGLGLAQVYAFMTQSNGTVEIESKLGEGTAVSLLFPRTTKPVEKDAVKRAADAPATSDRRLRVLLVEDDHEVATMTAEMLISIGHEVIRANSPAQALDLMKSNSIDLMLSDVMMAGGMSGLELARGVRAHRSELPVILATGLAQSADGAAAEGFQLLLKPYDLAALQRAIALAT